MTLCLAIMIVISGSAMQDLPATADELEAVYLYLFSKEQQWKFNSLDTQEEQQQIWNNYWQSVDPTPDTQYNELLRLFRDRFEELRFLQRTADFSEGWRGDRGRIYLLYGPPQKLYRNSRLAQFSDTQKAEVWAYSVIVEGVENSVELTFIDDDDNGIYELVTPMKFDRDMSLLPRLPAVDFQLKFK
jgi:GWxTD domain-containing protein